MPIKSKREMERGTLRRVQGSSTAVPCGSGLVAEVTDVDLIRRHASVRCDDGATYRCQELAIQRDCGVDLFNLREGHRVKIEIGTGNRARITGWEIP